MGYKLNVFQGTLDLVGSSSDNFSYEKITPVVVVTIPIYQQMIVHQNIEIDGTLIMNGTMVII